MATPDLGYTDATPLIKERFTEYPRCIAMSAGTFFVQYKTSSSPPFARIKWSATVTSADGTPNATGGEVEVALLGYVSAGPGVERSSTFDNALIGLMTHAFETLSRLSTWGQNYFVSTKRP